LPRDDLISAAASVAGLPKAELSGRVRTIAIFASLFAEDVEDPEADDVDEPDAVAVSDALDVLDESFDPQPTATTAAAITARPTTRRLDTLVI
jgi:hypothetical protein